MKKKRLERRAAKTRQVKAGGGEGVRRDVPLKKSAKDFAITRLKCIILHGMWNPSGSQKAKR